MRRFILTGLWLAAAASADAQPTQPVGVTVAAIRDTAPPTTSSLDLRTADQRVAATGERVLLASIGSAAGFMGGAYAGPRMFARGRGEWADFDSAINGAAIGSILVASTAAAIPELGSTCGFAKRLALSLLGSATGMVAGTAIGLTSRHLGGAALGMALGSAGGAGLAEAFC